MNRRQLLSTAIGASATLALPPALQAQASLRRLAVMMVNSESDPDGQTRIRAFRDGLRQLGWTEGRNIQIDYRWSVADPARARTHATELVATAPDVILANGTPAVTALQQATRKIPIVFVVVTDPIGAGIVQSLSRPGENITGFSTFEPEIGGKWIELLKETRSDLRRVAGIRDPEYAGFGPLWQTIEKLASASDIHTTTIAFRNPNDEIDSAVGDFGQVPGSGLIVLPTAINNVSRERIFALAERHRLPAIYPFRHYAVDGGLMSYGFDTPDLFRRSASYVDRILRGEGPPSLPVQAPTKFELVINLKTARSIELVVPAVLLARADEVIE